jgi:hypothetical protein
MRFELLEVEESNVLGVTEITDGSLRLRPAKADADVSEEFALEG